MSTAPLAEPIDSWIDPRWFDATDELRAWYRARPHHVRTLPGFLPETSAATLRAALRAHPSWVASRHLSLPGNVTEEVSEAAWTEAPEARRFSSHFVLRPIAALVDSTIPLPREARNSLMRFAWAALVGNEMRDWASAVTGARLYGKVGCELTRYAPGDHIVPHSDHYDGRRLALAVYLDDGDEESGGILHFRNEAGEESAHPPRFNQAALIPIHAGCQHWVSAWRRRDAGRETISLAFRPD